MSLPTLSEGDQGTLGKTNQEREIVEALTHMKSGCSADHDGFTAEWFKAFKHKLVPNFGKVYNYSFESGCNLPESNSIAYISLILRKDKGPEDPTSYRPVSLTNVDAKILAQILARRLESLITSLVKPEQSGLIKGRNLIYNTRRVFNIIQLATEKYMKGVVLSLDSLKAFAFAADFIKWDNLL